MFQIALSLETNNPYLIKSLKGFHPQTLDKGPGILYGQPKVHKTVISNIPQFPQIFSAINTPVYKLAKDLVPILSPLTFNDYTVKYSFTFAKELINFDHIIFLWLA